METVQEIGFVRLTNGGFVIVDWEDYEWVSQYKWQRMTKGGAYRGSSANGKSITIILHRELNRTPEGVGTDHRNRIRYDNTKANLRNASKSLNAANSSPRKRSANPSSRFKGVYFRTDCRSKPWAARIGSRTTLKHIGRFETETQAAEAYNREATIRFGEYALLNNTTEVKNAL